MSRRDFFEKERRKKMVTTYAISIVLSIVACVTIFVMYSQKLDNDAQNNLFALTDENEDIVPNDELELSSISQDKTINSVNTSNSVTSIPVKIMTENTTSSLNTTKLPEEKEPVTAIVNDKEIEKQQTNEVQEENTQNESEEENEKIELSFQAPVAGEIIKDYAMDTLIYSTTLDEWCTHNGIDIKAEKASIVCSSEKGIVESIKNDPRYGLSIIVNHGDGFKTVYANLLTTEFVKEGEEVEKGQTIATVGESASFEIADEAHLHFEMYKDGITVNPTIYFK